MKENRENQLDKTNTVVSAIVGKIRPRKVSARVFTANASEIFFCTCRGHRVTGVNAV